MSEDIKNIVAVSFQTTASYTDKELVGLQTALSDFITELDEDAIESTVQLRVIDEETAKTETLETVQDFLNNADVSVNLTVQHPDHKMFDIEFAEGDV